MSDDNTTTSQLGDRPQRLPVGGLPGALRPVLVGVLDSSSSPWMASSGRVLGVKCEPKAPSPARTWWSPRFPAQAGLSSSLISSLLSSIFVGIPHIA